MQIALIARNTFRESVRDRVLYNLIVFALLMTVASLFIGELAIGNETKIIIDLGLSAMRFFGMLIAIFIGIQLVFKEIERKTIYSVLSKPVLRTEFILGKFGGLALTLAVNSSVMLLGLVVALVYLTRPWAASASQTVEVLGPVFPAAFLIFLELLVVTAIALMFSTVTSPALAAALSFLVYVIGNFSVNFREMAETSASSTKSAILFGLYYALPNLSNFNRIESAAHGLMIPSEHLLRTLLYAALYCALLLAIAVAVFQRRDFK